MSDPDTDSPAGALEERVERLERLEWRSAAPRVSHVFARFYGPLAVVAVAMSFLPPYENVTIKHDGGGAIHHTYGTLWEMTTRGAPAPIGVILLLTLAAFLVAATVPVSTGPGLPVGVGICAGLLGLMLVSRPGTGDPTPGLTDVGVAEAALLFCCVAIAVTQLILQRTRKSHG